MKREGARNLAGAALLWWAMQGAAAGQPLLLDNFGSDGQLNTAVWGEPSAALEALATNYNSKWVRPSMAFGPGGMQLGGVNGEKQFTGVASIASFSPPFTATVTVDSSLAHGIPFEVVLVNDDLTSSVSLSGNPNNANDPWYGVWVNYIGSGTSFYLQGTKLYDQPTTNAVYTVQLSIDEGGTGTALLADTNGTALSRVTDLAVGLGPFHLALAQREGLPTAPGANLATWHSASVVAGAVPPVRIFAQPVLGAGPGLEFDMMLQGPLGANYMMEASTNLSDWMDIGTVRGTNLPFNFREAISGDRRFYRVRVE